MSGSVPQRWYQVQRVDPGTGEERATAHPSGLGRLHSRSICPILCGCLQHRVPVELVPEEARYPTTTNLRHGYKEVRVGNGASVLLSLIWYRALAHT